jgi:hypothetical protein
MKTSQAIATWLFERLDLEVALTGDLLEERARGRSAIWYWRQVLIAIWIGIWGAIRDNKALALRAVATGMAMELLLLFLWNQFSPLLERLLPHWSMLSVEAWTRQLVIVLLTQTLVGWVVAKTHRERQVPMVLLSLIFALLWWVQRTFAFARIVLPGSIGHPGNRIYAVWYFTNTFMLAAGVLLGGILGARPKKPSQEDGMA